MFGIDYGAVPLVRRRHPAGLAGIGIGLIWQGEERVQGDPRGPGGPPYSTSRGNKVLSRMRRVISSAVRYFSPSR